MSKIKNYVIYALKAIIKVVERDIENMKEEKDFDEQARLNILKNDLDQALSNFKDRRRMKYWI